MIRDHMIIGPYDHKCRMVCSTSVATLAQDAFGYIRALAPVDGGVGVAAMDDPNSDWQIISKKGIRV